MADDQKIASETPPPNPLASRLTAPRSCLDRIKKTLGVKPDFYRVALLPGGVLVYLRPLTAADNRFLNETIRFTERGVPFNSEAVTIAASAFAMIETTMEDDHPEIFSLDNNRDEEETRPKVLELSPLLTDPGLNSTIEMFSEQLADILVENSARSIGPSVTPEQRAELREAALSKLLLAARRPDEAVVVQTHDPEIRYHAARVMYQWLSDSDNIDDLAVQALHRVYVQEVEPHYPFSRAVQERVKIATARVSAAKKQT